MIGGHFDHQNRKQRFSKTKEIIINENYKIILLWGREYKKSISIKRYLNQFVYSRFLEISEEDWETSIYLPVERFEKATFS